MNTQKIIQISALVFTGAIFGAQETAAVRMNAAAVTHMNEKGLIGTAQLKPSREFNGTILKPVGETANGLEGSAAMKAAKSPNADSVSDIIEIRNAHTVQFAPVTDTPATKATFAALAARAHANLTTFDPRAVLTTPPNGATLNGTQLFAWTPGTSVSEYFLWVGSCRDCTDLLSENEGLHLSRTINLPVDGRLLYVTLFSYIGGAWYYVDYEFVANSAPTPAFLTSPANGATLSDPQTFNWTPGNNITDYFLWLGNCQDCNDLLNEDEGLNLGRTLYLPLDGRTVYATLFSYSNGTWYWVDYQFRAGKGAPVRVFVTNDLAYPLNIFINGASAGSVDPFQTQYADAVVTSMTVSFQLAAPVIGGHVLGDIFSGYFTKVDNASGTYRYDVTNVLGTSYFFLPQITNQTYQALEMSVNAGLVAQNQCNCVVEGYTNNVAFGYYQLFSNSNVRGYLNGSNYAGRYDYWGQDANGNIAPSGLLYKLAAAKSGIVKLNVTSAP